MGYRERKAAAVRSAVQERRGKYIRRLVTDAGAAI